MFKKYASATIISAEIATRNAAGLVKAAHRAVFDYEPRVGFLYVRSRMISSRCNDNFDDFPPDEIRASWKTAKGKPAFVNHHNEDHRRMRGVIIDAALHEDTLPDGKPDIWIEALHEIDAVKFPRLAEAIIKGRVNRTSMGCDVGFSVCSACNNKASSPAEYCEHIPKMKGKILYRHTASGQREGHLIREICHKLSFFENSFLVEDPADPTAVVTGIDDRGLKRQASLQKEAVPEGIKFHFTPGHIHPSGHHHIRATMPSKGGRGDVGYLEWDPNHGMVGMVNTDSGHREQGIASALWSRAHEVANEHGLTPPRHSDVQTNEGHQWAQKVDTSPVVMPGQQPLFDVPSEHATDTSVPQPQHADMFDHLTHDHGGMAASSLEMARDGGYLDTVHDNMHKYHSYQNLHVHSGRKKEAGMFKRKPRTDWMEDTGRQVTDLSNGLHVIDHLAKDHGWTEDDFQRAGASGGFRKGHDGLHEKGSAIQGFTDPKGQHFHAVRKEAAFGGYEDFDDCAKQNEDKDDPEAYCGEIKKRTEGGLRILEAAPKYPDPADHPFFKEHPVSTDNIVNSFMKADEGRRAQGMRWYSDAHHLASLISPDDVGKGAGVLAAYSPKAAWPDNMFNAARSFKEGRALGKGEGASIMGQHQAMAQKIMDGTHHSKAMKSPKISDFAHLIEHGDDSPDEKEAGKSRVVVDRHALSVATGKRMTTKHLEDAPLGSRHYYEHVAGKYREAAVQLSEKLGQKVAPHQVQAVTWGVQQEQNQAEDDVEPTGQAKGRNTRTRNSWTRWTEHTKSEHPKLHGEPPNLHGKNPYEAMRSSLPHVAYGETKAPQDVDTLRQESCPVCGETQAFDGDRCQVCHFIQPPSMFMDPDTGVAKQMDLRKDQFDQGMVGPNGEPIEGVPDPNDPNAMGAEQGMPGEPGDQIADLFCPACGFSADTQEPMTNNDPAQAPEEQGLLEGDVCPNCGEATMLSPNDVGAMGGEVPQEIADDADADGMPDDQEPDMDEDGIPDDAEPDVDGDGEPDDAEPDEDQDGVPDDAEEAESSLPGVEPQNDTDPDAVEDDEEPQKGRKDNPRRAFRARS